MSAPDSPISFSTALGRPIRQDGIATLGRSSQSLFEQALRERRWDLAEELAVYFWDEMDRIGQALHLWLEDLLGEHLRRSRTGEPPGLTRLVLRGLREHDVGEGDRLAVIEACHRQDPRTAERSCELMRTRWAAVHDTLVAWIQRLVGDLAEHHGEPAVLEALDRAYQRLWKPRYAQWATMPALERLQLSVEGMRGHLSGPRRRGDVGVEEHDDCYVMVLDPCGSCGILRRGDPDSGKPPARVEGNRVPHPWTWNRTGVGWYAMHSPIVMEHLWRRDHGVVMRPHRDCDTDLPCRWYVFKEPARARAMEPTG